jgi:hypothetical protein
MKEFVCQATDFIINIRAIMTAAVLVMKIAIIEKRVEIGCNDV